MWLVLLVISFHAERFVPNNKQALPHFKNRNVMIKITALGAMLILTLPVFIKNPVFGSSSSSLHTSLRESNSRLIEPTVSINVAMPPNTAPFAIDDWAVTIMDTSVMIDVQDNDSDPENDPLVTSITAMPVNGNASVISGDSIYYTPNPGFVGNDTLLYQVCDPGGLCTEATVVIAVEELNEPPVALDDSTTTLEDQFVTIDVQVNDWDPNGDSINTVIATPAVNGSVAVLDNDSILYTPDAGFNGLDQFVYNVCDTGGLCGAAVVRIYVVSTNEPPVAENDYDTIAVNTSAVIEVIANDFDPDFDTLAAYIFDDPANGEAFMNGSEIHYTPNPSFRGNDTIQYEVCDPEGGCDQALVIITIPKENTYLIAVDDYADAEQFTATPIAVLDNDFHSDEDSLIISYFTQGTNGSVTQSGEELIYQSTPSFYGVDRFTYAISDARGRSDTAVVYVTVEEPLDLSIPTGITPNGDGFNDAFVVQGIHPLDRVTINIVNRWGMQVYETKNYQNDWVGENQQGEELPDGTYFVVLNINQHDKSEEKSYSGYVDVRRE